ncbi:MAG: acyl-CoA dehydrogenase family protein [Jatrophihabitantaceae bacterium]
MSSAVAEQSDPVLVAVAELAERLRNRGAEIESAARLPADVVAGLRQAGVFQLWMPRELGGLEAEPATVLQIIQTLSAADGSTGWCAATGLASNSVGGFVPEAGARQLYPTGLEMAGGALMPGGRAVPQPDGSYLVEGQWSFGSGVQHCDWVVGGAVVVGGSMGAGGSATGGPPAIRAMVMPAAEVEFLDNWEVAGLQGTASVDYRAIGIRVPAEHSLALDRIAPWPAGPMWRIPLMSLIFPLLAAVPLGLARRAVSELAELALTKTPFRTGRLLADREVLQAVVARATALIESGHHYLLVSMQALWQAGAAGAAPTVRQRAQARLAGVHATEAAAEAVLLCYRAAGSTALYRNSPLQRLLRDVNAATQHYGISATGYEMAGRALLGMEPDPGL